MNTIEKIKTKIRQYPDLRYESEVNSISVFPMSEDGFKVSIKVDPDSLTVSFNGWHEKFQSEEEALNCFSFGLSSDCRLREYRRGTFAYKWTVESNDNGEWVEDSTTGLIVFPFWKRQEARYLQNELINTNQNAKDDDI